VVSVEVNFYPKYREYYSLFNDKGTIGDILRVEKEMLETMKRELWFTALKQLFVTAACICLGEFILNLLPLGFNDLMHGYFRTLTVGYGIYAIANTFILLLLYFTDYTGALRASILFAAATSGFTLISLVFDVRFLPNPYYVEELRFHTGTEKAVQDYVMQGGTGEEFLKKLNDLLEFVIPKYEQEGKTQLVIAIGCTGGRHRSVTIAGEVFKRLTESGRYEIRLEHRDAGKDGGK